MPRVTINGVEYEARDGQTIIEVADEHGIDLPRFCYHPGLTVAGNCRICLVDVEKAPKPQIACGTPVVEGMVVHTENEKARWARQGVMEFLLLNHPLDCPICDKAGECMLQWYSVLHGPGRSRLAEAKEHYAKRLDIGRHIVLDQERCILCSRCVRFCDEITGTSELGIYERGVRAVLDVVPGKRLDNAYSGCVTDVCPVGALTLKEFRFKARVWFLRDVPSICPGCSRGCNVNVGVHEGRIARLMPRTNTAVNDYWMCDLGRLIHRELDERPRLLFPQLREGERWERSAWKDAVLAGWERLRDVADDVGEGSVAAVATARATSEEIYLMRRLVREQLAGSVIAFPERREGEDDGILLNADRTPNRRGARELCGPGSVDGSGLAEIRRGIEEGRIKALLVLGENVMDLDGWSDGLLDRLDALVVVESFAGTGLLSRAHVALPLAVWAESDGTFVNEQGRVQRLRAAVRPPGEARPGWRILSEMGAAAGWQEAYPAASDVMDELARSVPVFRDLAYGRIGLAGAPLPGAGAEAGAGASGGGEGGGRP